MFQYINQTKLAELIAAAKAEGITVSVGDANFLKLSRSARSSRVYVESRDAFTAMLTAFFGQDATEIVPPVEWTRQRAVAYVGVVVTR